MRINVALDELINRGNLWTIVYRDAWTKPDCLGKNIDYLFMEEGNVCANVIGPSDKHAKIFKDYSLTEQDINADDWCIQIDGFHGEVQR